MRRLSILLPVALAAAVTAMPAGSTTLDPKSIHEKVFPSGLRLIVKEAHGADLVAIQVWVRAGGFLEDAKNTGTAHAIEHLVFKGTEQRGPGSIDQEIEDMGGELGAMTEKDWTQFGTTVASQHALKAIDVMGDTIRNPRFRSQDLQEERPLILEELALAKIDPEKLVATELFQLAYRKHPYGRDARGDESVINHLNLESVRAFYRKHYSPASITVVVVGDVPTEAIEKQVSRAFGADAAGPSKPPYELTPPETACQKPDRKVVPTPLQISLVGMAFPAPGISDRPDVYAMDILVTLLENGAFGRLPRALRGKSGGVKATFTTRRQPGILTVLAQARPKDLEAVEKAVRDAMEDLLAHPPTDEEIAFTKRQLAGNFTLENETFAGQANSLGFYDSIDRWQFATTYLDQIRDCTREQVITTAKKYLTLEHSCTVILQPRPPRPGSGAGASAATGLESRVRGRGSERRRDSHRP